jgi:hypothetical protein
MTLRATSCRWFATFVSPLACQLFVDVAMWLTLAYWKRASIGLQFSFFCFFLMVSHLVEV